MLVIMRNNGQELHIGDNIRIILTDCHHGRCKVLIDAPREIPITRPDAKKKEPKPCDS